MTEESKVAQFYAFKKILITGGTGFMGKVLIWKLLYSCPELDTIYTLIRSKYGKNLTARKEEFFKSPIFDNFKKNDPKRLEKVVFISGDVGEKDMGLSDDDRNMFIDEVSVIFHGAAILKMNADLQTAVNVNTVGTIRMLDMAEQMKQLEAFVHISTAFCCCENSTIEEKIYPSKHDPYHIINFTSWVDPELLKQITPKLIYPSPNTYIYSKRLTESLLQNYVSRVPIIVARPSVVLPCFKEPIPGWTDSMNGPAGFFAAGAKGVVRTTRLNLDSKTDFIPVDLAINSIIILPWANSRAQLLKALTVYNISQNAHEDLTWRDMLRCLLQALDKYPLEMILWYRGGEGGASNSNFTYTIKSIFMHYLPAYVIDFILVVGGQKPFLVQVHDKLRHGEKVLMYFSMRQWSFAHKKLLNLEKLMNETDKMLFPVNMDKIEHFQDYMDDCMKSAKVYVFKEDLKRIDKSRRIMNIMYLVDKITLVLRYFILWKILTLIFNLLWGIIY